MSAHLFPLNSISDLPHGIRSSTILLRADLEQLITIAEIPAINPAFADDRLKNIFQYYSINPSEMEVELHMYAKQLIQQNNITDAWQVLLAGELA
jgi:hypothetical protein